MHVLESTWLFIEIIAAKFIHMLQLPSQNPRINTEEKAEIQGKIEEYQNERESYNMYTSIVLISNI